MWSFVFGSNNVNVHCSGSDGANCDEYNSCIAVYQF